MQNQSKGVLETLATAYPKIQWSILRDSVSLQELDMSYKQIIKLRWPKNNEEEDVNKNDDAIIDETIDALIATRVKINMMTQVTTLTQKSRHPKVSMMNRMLVTLNPKLSLRRRLIACGTNQSTLTTTTMMT